MKKFCNNLKTKDLRSFVNLDTARIGVDVKCVFRIIVTENRIGNGVFQSIKYIKNTHLKYLYSKTVTKPTDSDSFFDSF